MSPEQAVGDDVDARSDIFSLGVILYEMLTLQRPFTAPTALRAMQALVHADPKPIREVVTGVPQPLVDVVMRCLAKNPEERFQSAGELAPALGQVGHEPAASVRRFPKLRWKAGRRSPVFTAIGVAVIALAIAGYTAFHKLSPVLPGAAARPAVYASEHDAYQSARVYLDRYDKKGNIDRAVEALDAALRLNPNYAIAYAGMSEAYLRPNIVTPDRQWVKAAHDSAIKAVALNPDLAVAQTALGNVLPETGDRGGAAVAFRKAIDLDPSQARAWLGLAKLAAAAGKREEAETQYQKSISLAPKDWIPITEYGIFLYRNAKYADAAAQWEKAIALAPDNARILRNLGGVYHELDRSDDAASALQRALEIEPTAQVYANLGTLRYFQGRYVDAAAAVRSAVDRGGAGLYLYWGNLGDALRWVPGQRGTSAEAYTHASELVREKLQSAQDDTDLRSSLAMYLAKSGDSKTALQETDKIDKSPKKRAASFFRVSLACEVAGNRDRALYCLDAAFTAGYSVREIRDEPELAGLGADARFREMLYRHGGAG